MYTFYWISYLEINPKFLKNQNTDEIIFKNEWLQNFIQHAY